jgi:hypothetical protein
MGWTYAFPNRCELEKLCGLYSTGFSSYEISMLQLLRRREVNERLCIEEVGVDLDPLCSCPWTRCGAYHESFLQEYLIIWIILSVSINWIPCSYGPDHANLIHYIWKETIPVPRLFLTRLKYLLSQVSDPAQFLFWSSFEYYPLVSRWYHGTAILLMRLVKYSFSLIQYSTGFELFDNWEHR